MIRKHVRDNKDSFLELEREILGIFARHELDFTVKRVKIFHNKRGSHTLARIDTNLPASKEMFATISTLNIRDKQLLAGKDGELERCLRCKGLGHGKDSDLCTLNHSVFVIHMNFTVYPYQTERLTKMLKAESVKIGTPERPIPSGSTLTLTYSRQRPLRSAHQTIKSMYDNRMISNFYHHNPELDCGHCGHRQPKHARDCPHYVERPARPSIPPLAPPSDSIPSTGHCAHSFCRSRGSSPARSSSVQSCVPCTPVSVPAQNPFPSPCHFTGEVDTVVVESCPAVVPPHSPQNQRQAAPTTDSIAATETTTTTDTIETSDYLDPTTDPDWVAGQFHTNAKVPDGIADKLLTHLKSTYTSDPYEKFGQHHQALFARSESGHGKSYSFTGKSKGLAANTPDAIISEAADIMVKTVAPDRNPTCILSNGYRDGNQYIKAHSDINFHSREPEDAYMLAVGAKRLFRFTHIRSKLTYEYFLEHGHIYHITRELNSHYKHERVQNPEVKGFSASLTTRDL